MILTVDKVWCSKCRRMRPRSAFNKNKRTRNGLQSLCRDCHNPMCARTKKRQPENPLIVVRRALLAYYLALKEGIASPKYGRDGRPAFRVRDEMRRATQLLEELS